MKNSNLLVAAAALLAVLAAADGAEAKGHRKHAGPAKHALSGSATYYGGSDGFCGRPVAGGGVLDCKKLVAAHRSLPFGTVLDVRNRSGRTVRVEVVDRGPFTGAFIDLSPEAAKQIGGLSTHHGLTAEVVSMGNGTISAANYTPGRRGGTRLAKAKTGVQVAAAGPLQLGSFLNGGNEDPMRPASIFGNAHASAGKVAKKRR